MATKAFRLPTALRPTHYDIHLDARVGSPTFRGRVAISVLAGERTDRVLLHGRDVDVSEAVVVSLGRRLRAEVAPDPDAEALELRLPEPLPPGPATVELAFTGKVSRNMEGLYLSKDGPEECLATQCEETDARAIFPCFDEPAFKARFQWTVTTDPDVTVLANGRLLGVDEAPEARGRTWRFAPTRPMSSYLVALVVGRVAGTPERVERGVPLRVWAMEGKERFGGFGNDFAARLLPWYEDYFQAPYHFEKYDQVAVPSFAAGAMENSGLVLFRQSLLLVDPKTTSWRAEKQAALVIAHEAAHMWFGNLVTMAWWDDIWLNEAFAEWMAHKATHALRPDYRVWEDFQSGRTAALAADSLASTHPIYSKVETPEQATEMFDAITYQKGCAVMRMLESFLGEEAFRDGLRAYMREFGERNAAGPDLWRHLEAASRQPVGRIMGSWIGQGGHPVVGVDLDESAQRTRLRLRQSRFFSAPDVPDPGQVWDVPLVLRYADDAGVHEHRHLLSARENALELPVRGRLRWLHANADAYGFYRQELDAGLADRLLAHLGELSPLEQMAALDDKWGLVRAARRPVSRYLDLLDATMGAASSHSVMERVASSLVTLEGHLEDAGDAEALARFRSWVAARLGPALDEVGVDPRPGEEPTKAACRVALMEALALVAQEPRAVRAALALAERERVDPSAVDANLAGVGVAAAAQQGDAASFEAHVREYVQRRDAKAPPTLTGRYLNSFAHIRDPALVRRALGLWEQGVLSQESVGPLLRLMLLRRHAQTPAWETLKARWRNVREELGDMWTGFLVEHTGHLPPALRADVVAFYDANLEGVAQQSYARALEMMDQKAELQARVHGELVAWMRRAPGA